VTFYTSCIPALLVRMRKQVATKKICSCSRYRGLSIGAIFDFLAQKRIFGSAPQTISLLVVQLLWAFFIGVKFIPGWISIGPGGVPPIFFGIFSGPGGGVIKKIY